MVADFIKKLFALAAMQCQHLEIGSEALGFEAPIGHQAGGSDHQRWAIRPAAPLFHQDVRQGLHGLAEAHVIGEDATEFDFAQELQPA